jgi:hypothetical protein
VHVPLKVLGQVTAIEWLPIDPLLTICIGSALGYVGVWRQTSKGAYGDLYAEPVVDGKEVISITADKPTLDGVLFAIGTLGGHVALWRFDNNGMHPIFSLSIGYTIPRKVAFSYTTVALSTVRTMVVFGMYDGKV